MDCKKLNVGKSKTSLPKEAKKVETNRARLLDTAEVKMVGGAGHPHGRNPDVGF